MSAMDTIIDEVYTPHNRVEKFRKVKAFAPNEIWTMDLTFMTRKDIVEANEGAQYILACMDEYSRYAFARALKKKDAKTVKEALLSIFREAEALPQKIWVDEGGEFYNKDLAAFLKMPGKEYTFKKGGGGYSLRSRKTAVSEEKKDEAPSSVRVKGKRAAASVKEEKKEAVAVKEKRMDGVLDEGEAQAMNKARISLYSTHGKDKATLIERFNRTLKNKMLKRLFKQRNLRWVDILPLLIEEYNNTPSSSLDEFTPHQVYVDGAVLITEPEPLNVEPPAFQMGDRVRIPEKIQVFDKGHYPLWTYQLFVVSRVIPSIPYTYKVEDEEGKMLKRAFYESELLRTKQEEGVYLVEKVEDVEMNSKGKPKAYLVKWLGCKEPTWVDAKTFEKTAK